MVAFWAIKILQKVRRIPQKILSKLGQNSDKVALFDHKIAQEYEFNYAKTAIQADFKTVSDAYEKRKPHYHTSKGQFFEGDEKLRNEFIAHSTGKSALEVGSGPFGYLAFFDGPKEKYFIEPLIKRYRGFQLQTFGKTFFPEEKNLFDVPAEFFVKDLKIKLMGSSSAEIVLITQNLLWRFFGIFLNMLRSDRICFSG